MLSQTQRTQIKKGAHKAVLEEQALYDIIDESLIAHIAIKPRRQSNHHSYACLACR